jgi:hypothetical protein
MNKKILQRTFFAAIVAISINGCVSTEPYKPIELTNVIELKEMDQGIIFNGARQWFSEYFVSGESVIDYEDKDTGTIIGNGISRVGSDPFGIISYGINYTLRVDTKDGKLRISTKISKFTNSDSTNGTYDVANVSPARISEAEANVNLMVKSLEDYIQKNSKSEW